MSVRPNTKLKTLKETVNGELNFCSDPADGFCIVCKETGANQTALIVLSGERPDFVPNIHFTNRNPRVLSFEGERWFLTNPTKWSTENVKLSPGDLLLGQASLLRLNDLESGDLFHYDIDRTCVADTRGETIARASSWELYLQTPGTQDRICLVKWGSAERK